MNRARRASIDVNYEHVNITDGIKGSVKTLSYTDVASRESDSISLSLQDWERKWMGSWAPRKGDHINTSMTFYDWDGMVITGESIVDSLRWMIFPCLVRLRRAKSVLYRFGGQQPLTKKRGRRTGRP